MKPDKDTATELTDAEHLSMMTQGKGWSIAYHKLTEAILDLQNINNVDTSSIESMTVDLKARKIAADMLFNWVKRDIYGTVEQAEVAKQALMNEQDNTYIGRESAGT